MSTLGKWRMCLVAAGLLVLSLSPSWSVSSRELLGARAAALGALRRAGAFPAGTKLLSVSARPDGVVVVDLSARALVGLDDARSDAMVSAFQQALARFATGGVEVLVEGRPICSYLPPRYLPESSPPQASPALSAIGGSGLLSATGSELAGRVISLAASHGWYKHETYDWLTQRPWMPYAADPAMPWPSICEDFTTPNMIWYADYYLRNAGATVWECREVYPEQIPRGPVRSQDFADRGIWPASFPLLRADLLFPGDPFEVQRAAYGAKYYLQWRQLPPPEGLGDVIPDWVWSDPAGTTEYIRDYRSRPNYANYRGSELHVAVHTNAVSGNSSATGTETYWYVDPNDPDRAAKAERARRWAGLVHTSIVRAIREIFDDSPGRDRYSLYVPPAGYPSNAAWRARPNAPNPPYAPKEGNYAEVRIPVMPACLVEVAFHDDFNYYPDHYFLATSDGFKSAVGYGIYRAACEWFEVTPKPPVQSAYVSDTLPSIMGGAKTSYPCTVTFRNEGIVWNAEQHFQLHAAPGSDPFLMKQATYTFGAFENIRPGETKTWDITLEPRATDGSTDGIYTTAWQMARTYLGDPPYSDTPLFGDIASKQVIVDYTPPALTCPAQRISVGPGCAAACPTVTAADNLDPHPVVTQVPPPGTVLPLGATVVSAAATDWAGNTAQCSATITVADTTPPVIGIGALADSYILRQPITISFSATDNCVVAWLSATLNGEPFVIGDTVMATKPGANTLVITATDAAGNVATAERTFLVTYRFDGFSPPLPTRNIQMNSAVPVKFRLYDFSGRLVHGVTAKLWLAKLDGSPDPREIPAVSADSPTGDNTFRELFGQYIFNLSTKLSGLSPGHWRLRADLGDGADHSQNIGIRG